jgi:hypothetical protein
MCAYMCLCVMRVCARALSARSCTPRAGAMQRASLLPACGCGARIGRTHTQDCVSANRSLYALKHSPLVLFVCHAALGKCHNVGTGMRDAATVNAPGVVWASDHAPPVVNGTWAPVGQPHPFHRVSLPC